MSERDVCDLWWEWAEKPIDSYLTIPAEIHNPIMALSPEDRQDREKVNESVRKYRAEGPPARTRTKKPPLGEISNGSCTQCTRPTKACGRCAPG